MLFKFLLMSTKENKSSEQLGSSEWNNEMYLKHPTPYHGIAGKVEKLRTKRIFDEWKDRITKDAVIVEVGCEQGNMLAYFEERLKRKKTEVKIIGIDISTTALKDAKQKLSNRVELIEHDITQDHLPSLPPVDVLICSETLEHIPDYGKAVAQLAKIANEDTLIIITIPLEKYKNKIKSILIKMRIFDLFFKGIEASLSEWHVNDFSKEDILSALKPYFEVKSYSLLCGLHQIITLSKRKVT